MTVPFQTHAVSNPGKKTRAKKTESAPAVEPVENAHAADLVAEHLKIEEWIKAESKRFAEHIKPHKDRLEAIGNQLLALSNTQKWDSIRTDAGTAYRSTLLNVSVSPEGLPYTSNGAEVVGREALLDFALDHWDDIGNDLLLVSAQKDSVKKFMEDHEGKPPPGIKTSWFTRINIRKS